jgi:hypothetical protein
MAKILIVGDSQAQGTPGLYTQQKFEAAGHTVRRISQHGCGPIDWSSDAVSAGCRTPGLWSRYTGAVNSFRPDAIVLIFGSNDFGSRLQGGLAQMKTRVGPPVWMSGPPQYPSEDRQRLGETIKTANQAVFGARWIDAYPFTPLSLPRDHPDEPNRSAHFVGAAGRPWGEAIADAVMRGMGAPGATPSGGDGGGTALGPPAGAGRLALAAAGAVAALGLLWWLTRRPVRQNRRRRR